jgi:nitroimidazol reductase NimA-like FMN-containing flavoprotein (pyridoxamine 5'-phosphate oxidase superfamily)
MWLPSPKFHEANKEKYDEFLKTLTEVDDLDEELREKFWNHLKKFLQEELKRKEPHDLKWSKDTQMSEILGEFKNGALD